MVDIYGKLVGKYTIVPWESVMGNGSCELAKGLVAVVLTPVVGEAVCNHLDVPLEVRING